MTREEMLTTIRELAEKLGHPPTMAELQEMTMVTREKIRRKFGTYTWTLREAGLETRHRRQTISTDKLFAAWTAAVRKLGKVPSMKEFEQVSEYTVGPYQREFRTWSRVPEAMVEYASTHGLLEEWQDVQKMISGWREAGLAATSHKWGPGGGRHGSEPTRVREDRPVYGMPWEPVAMLNEPTNEQGVLFLFGAMAVRLGFMVTLIRTAFPDCEALRAVGERRCQQVKIEFEYESRNFLRHGHDLARCDVIVCWIHNWAECPLEVVELSAAVSDQYSAVSQRQSRSAGAEVLIGGNQRSSPVGFGEALAKPVRA